MLVFPCVCVFVFSFCVTVCLLCMVVDSWWRIAKYGNVCASTTNVLGRLFLVAKIHDHPWIPTWNGTRQTETGHRRMLCLVGTCCNTTVCSIAWDHLLLMVCHSKGKRMRRKLLTCGWTHDQEKWHQCLGCPQHRARYSWTDWMNERLTLCHDCFTKWWWWWWCTPKFRWKKNTVKLLGSFIASTEKRDFSDAYLILIIAAEI